MMQSNAKKEKRKKERKKIYRERMIEIKGLKKLIKINN